MNKMSELNIKCHFYESGRHQVVGLKSLFRRLEECDYNLCVHCGLEVGKTGHNCVNALKSKLILIEIENEDLINTNKYIMDQNVKSIRKLNKKIEVLRKQLIESDIYGLSLANKIKELSFDNRKLREELETRNNNYVKKAFKSIGNKLKTLLR